MYKYKVFLVTCGIYVLLVVAPSFAQEPAESQEGPQFFDEASIPVELAEDAEDTEGAGDDEVGTNGLVSFSLYLRVFFILGLLIVLIYFTLKFLRRLSLQKPNQHAGGGVRVLSSQMLYADRMLHVVEVAGECYLLGSSSSSVALLDHYKDKDVKDRILLETTQEPNSENRQNFSFFDLIRRRIKSQGSEGAQVRARPYGERLRNAVQTLQNPGETSSKAGSEGKVRREESSQQKDAL